MADGKVIIDTDLDTSSFESGISKLGSIAKTGLTVVTAAIAAVSAGIVAAGTAALQTGKDFDTAMSQVAATMGTTVDQIGDMSDKAKELGASTKFTATEAAEGLNILAMAGLDAEECIAGIDTVLDLASAGAMDMASAATYVTGAVKGFSDSMDNAQYYADLMAKGATLANTDVSSLGEALSSVSSTASGYGQEVDSVTVALLRLAEQNVTGSEAATALNRAMMDLYTPTDDAAAALEKLGVKVYDETGTARDFNDVIDDLSDALSDYSDEEANAYKNTIFTTYGLQAFNKMTVSSEEKVESFKEGLAGASEEFDGLGAAAGQAATQLDNLEGDMTLFSSALDGFWLSIYSTVSDGAREIVELGTSCITELTEAFEKDGYEGLISAAGKILAELLQKVAEAAPELLDMASSLITSFCEGLTGTDGIASAGTKLITALITAVLENGSTLYATAITLVGQLAGGLAEGAPDVIAAALDGIAGILDAITEALPQVVDSGLQIVDALISGLAEGAPQVLESAVSLFMTVIQAIPEVVASLTGELPKIVDAIVSALGDGLPQVLQASITLLLIIADAIPEVVTALAESLPEIVEAIVGALGDRLPKVLEGAQQMFQGLLDAIPTVIESLTGILPDIVTTIFAFLVSAFPQIIDAAIQMLSGIVDAIPTVMDSIIASLPQIITAIVTGLADAVPEILEGAITLWMALIEAIPEIVVALAENLPEIIEAIATGLIDAAPQIMEAALEMLMQVVYAIPEVVAGVVTAVPDIIAGIVNGLLGGIGEVFSAAVDLGSGLLDGIKSFFGINSPSTVMAEQGDYLVQGLAEGLMALPESVMEALSEALSDVVSWGADLLAKGSEIANNTVTSIVDFFGQLPSDMLGYLNTAFTNVTTWGANTLNSAKTAASNVLTSVTSSFSQLPGKIASQLTSTLSKVTSFASNFVSKMKTAATNAVSNMVSQASQLPGKIATQLSSVTSKVTSWGSNLVSSFKSIGKNVISGLISGITSMVSSLYSSIKSALSGLVSKAKSALGISSPSKVFAEEVGEWIPPGIAEGVENEMPELEKQVDDEMEDLAQNAGASVTAAVSADVKWPDLTNYATQLKAAAELQVSAVNAKIDARTNSGEDAAAAQRNEADYKRLGESVADALADGIEINGETHVHVDLDKKEIGHAVSPYVDKEIGQKAERKKRGS